MLLFQEFDVILHKLTEDMESSEPESVNKLNSICEYLKKNPHTVIIDPFEAVKRVVSRARTSSLLNILIESNPKCPFEQPRFAVAESPELIKDAIKQQGLKYPVICKPIEACGTPSAHSMVRQRHDCFDAMLLFDDSSLLHVVRSGCCSI